MIRVNPILLTVLAYAIGATPTSFWVAKAGYGVDLRTKGSGNLGSTNPRGRVAHETSLPHMRVPFFLRHANRDASGSKDETARRD